MMIAAARRRAWSVPRLPRVIMRSPHRRSSLALPSVVRTASCSRSAVTRFRKSARRCAGERFSFTPATPCRISGGLLLPLHPAPVELLARREILEPHPEREPHLVQELLDLVQRLPAEVLRLQHLLLGLLHELADVLDVGILQAVGRADRELEVVDRTEEVLVQRDLAPFLASRRRRLLFEVDEDPELLLEE